MSGFTNKDIAAAAGAKSKRGANSDVELLRAAITKKLNIEQLFYEISELDLNDRVNARIRLLGYVLPKLQSIDLTATGEMTITQFISLSSSDQDRYLETLVNGSN